MTFAGTGRAFARFAASCFISALLAALVLPVTASAGDQEDSPGKMAAEQPESASRWTVSTEAIVLDHSGNVNRTLVARVPGSTQFCATAGYPWPGCTAPATGVEAFNSNQFQDVFSAGPKINLIYHGDAGYSVELLYFNIFNQSATKVTGPDNPAGWLVMKAPGGFWQTQDFAYQGMAWGTTTNLYSAEANGRLDLSRRVTLLAGFRWLQLNDNLVGTLPPPDVMEPTWKQPCLLHPSASNCDIFHIQQGTTPAGTNPPFWNTATTNNLYGIQIGVDGKILEYGRISLEGLIKFGVFDNNAEQWTGVSMQKTVYPSGASASHTALLTDGGLQLKYQISKGLAVKAGYEALWLNGVALAPGQIRETSTAPSSVTALGVNSGSSVFFQGVTVGLEYSF